MQLRGQAGTCFVYPVKVYNGAGELIRTVPVKELIDEMFKDPKPRKQRVLGHANCACCGDRFGKVRERQRFCKIDCQRQWARDDKKAKRRAKTVTKNCKTCEKDFITHLKTKVYCNDPCQSPKKMVRPPRTVECAICYKTYTTSRHNSRFCGKPCDATLLRSVKNKRQTQLRNECTKSAHSVENGT